MTYVKKCVLIQDRKILHSKFFKSLYLLFYNKLFILYRSSRYDYVIIYVINVRSMFKYVNADLIT